MTNTLNNSIVTGNSLSKSDRKGHSTMRYLVAIPFAFLLQTAVGTAEAFTGVCKDSADYACWYEGTWVAPSEAAIPNTATGDMIRYGKLLLAETYKYLGDYDGKPAPYNTTALRITRNKISCTNCHLDDGKAAHGQPWAVVWYKYGAGGQGPYSTRSNRYLDMANRIHDCTIRSMHGNKQLVDGGYEILSMIEYMKWLATGLQVADWNLVTSKGASNISAGSLTRAADPVRGKTVYEDNCAACHGYTGDGVFDSAANRYIYPAVWGPNSFNHGAGMFRLRTAAGFIKGNMPYGWANASDPTRQLSTADTWDAMAYVLSNDRPLWANYLIDWNFFRPSDCMPNWVNKIVDAGYANYFPRVEPTGILSSNTTYPQKYPDTKHMYGPWSDMLTLQTSMQNAYLAITPRPVYPACKEFAYNPGTGTGTLR
ncbi:MAG: c-type cytochrome [Planctomycetota bacterium]